VSSDKPREFDEVVKPAYVNKSQEELPAPQKGKEWDGFIGQINDAYINSLRELAKRNEFILSINGEQKTFQRRKITTKQYKELELMRTRLADEKDPRKFSTLNTDIYERCFELYLSGTKEDFDDGDFEEIKKVCDACSFRTSYGVPN
jgi:hypothetical protein